MKNFAKSGVGLIAGLALMIMMARAAVRDAVQAFVPKLPEDLKLNGPLPPSAVCFWQPYEISSDHECLVGTNIYLSYDSSRRAVTGISMWVYGQVVTMAMLMQALGTPDGLEQTGWLNVVYWGEMYAYVVGGPFAPDSRITSLGWRSRGEVTEWKGFVNR